MMMMFTTINLFMEQITKNLIFFFFSKTLKSSLVLGRKWFLLLIQRPSRILIRFWSTCYFSMMNITITKNISQISRVWYWKQWNRIDIEWFGSFEIYIGSYVSILIISGHFSILPPQYAIIIKQLFHNFN